MRNALVILNTYSLQQSLIIPRAFRDGDAGHNWVTGSVFKRLALSIYGLSRHQHPPVNYIVTDFQLWLFIDFTCLINSCASQSGPE